MTADHLRRNAYKVHLRKDGIMKKTILVICFIFMIGGCASLEHTQSLKPSLIQTLDKNTRCVFEKLSMNMTTKQTDWWALKIIWSSGYDGEAKMGKIVATNQDGQVPVVVMVYAKDRMTIIELRSDYYLERYKELALEAINTTDYSRCENIIP